MEVVQNEEFNNLYLPADIIRVRWAGHVTYIHAKFWSENLKRRKHLEDVNMVGKIILDCILRKWGGKV
jgi:hypothetical protein